MREPELRAHSKIHLCLLNEKNEIDRAIAALRQKIGDQTIGTVSTENSTLELENGKLVITRGAAIARPIPTVSKKTQRAVF